MQQRLRGLILGVALVFVALAAYAETVTLSTFYPSPYGSYQNLDTTGETKLATESGKVVIGPVSESEKPPAMKEPPVLDVNGNVHITGTVTANWLNTTQLSPSDLRFKTDLKPLAGVLPKLDRVHSFSYEKSKLARDLGQPSTGRRELGVLGQELEKVFPELVLRSGPQEYRSVDYGRLTVVLLQAIRELREETSALKRSNADLKRQVASQCHSREAL